MTEVCQSVVSAGITGRELLRRDPALDTVEAAMLTVELRTIERDCDFAQIERQARCVSRYISSPSFRSLNTRVISARLWMRVKGRRTMAMALSRSGRWVGHAG
jgi:hypothetical protein